MINIHKIVARDLPDLWFQAVNDILDVGRRFEIHRGSYEGQTRLEYDYFIGHVRHPGHGSFTPEILPQIPPAIGIPNPVEFDYVYGGDGYERSYVEYVMGSIKNPNESYTYGERLTRHRLGTVDELHTKEGTPVWELSPEIFVQEDVIWNDPRVIIEEDGVFYLNQVELTIKTYMLFGPRNNQRVLQVAKPDDDLLQDPPCLRQIDTRIQDDTLHFFVYFRSWDLWGGLPANLPAIQHLKEYMANEIGVKDGEMIVESKGLHLYGYAERLAQLRCMKEECDDQRQDEATENKAQE